MCLLTEKRLLFAGEDDLEVMTYRERRLKPLRDILESREKTIQNIKIVRLKTEGKGLSSA
jgi:hypothetical protein